MAGPAPPETRLYRAYFTYKAEISGEIKNTITFQVEAEDKNQAKALIKTWFNVQGKIILQELSPNAEPAPYNELSDELKASIPPAPLGPVPDYKPGKETSFKKSRYKGGVKLYTIQTMGMNQAEYERAKEALINAGILFKTEQETCGGVL